MIKDNYVVLLNGYELNLTTDKDTVYDHELYWSWKPCSYN